MCVCVYVCVCVCVRVYVCVCVCVRVYVCMCEKRETLQVIMWTGECVHLDTTYYARDCLEGYTSMITSHFPLSSPRSRRNRKSIHVLQSPAYKNSKKRVCEGEVRVRGGSRVRRRGGRRVRGRDTYNAITY